MQELYTHEALRKQGFMRYNDMKIDWNLFFSALALVLVLESVPYILAPVRMRGVLAELGKIDPRVLRFYGLIMLFIGIAALYVVRHF